MGRESEPVFEVVKSINNSDLSLLVSRFRLGQKRTPAGFLIMPHTQASRFASANRKNYRSREQLLGVNAGFLMAHHLRLKAASRAAAIRMGE
jgi:hypothetical protein